MIIEVLQLGQSPENPMSTTSQMRAQRPNCHEILASRLLQLAHDTDRVGLHSEANALAHFAASVLDGRSVAVTDA